MDQVQVNESMFNALRQIRGYVDDVKEGRCLIAQGFELAKGKAKEPYVITAINANNNAGVKVVSLDRLLIDISLAATVGINFYEDYMDSISINNNEKGGEQ